jgi:ATP:corrinoid adenosyltransferase
MDSSQGPAADLADEFRKLGENLKNAFRSTWESEERRRLQREIEDGLSDIAASLNDAARDFAASPTGQQLKADWQDLEGRVRSGEMETKIRDELVKALRMINTEIEKAAAGLDKKPDDQA